MKVKELVAQFKFESSGFNRVKNFMQALIDKLHQTDTAAEKTKKELEDMGAFQDKLGRWHEKSGKFLSINADGSPARANIAGVQSALQGLTNVARMVGGAIVAAFAVDRIIEFGKAVQKSADEMMNMDGRLRTITSTDEERYDIEDRLYSLAQKNRQGMKEMGNLYFKIANGTKKYGFNNEDFMRATDIVSKSLTIGGASTGEANSTVLQLGQALGSGYLMGDELNSLNENAQPLMQKIAEYFGKDIGELKEMGSQRELKSEDIMKAILSAGPKMDEEFSKMPVTIAQAQQKMSNSWDRFIQMFQRKTNFFGKVADTLSGTVDFVSNTMEDLFAVLDSAESGNPEGIMEFAKAHPLLMALYDTFMSIGDAVDYVREQVTPLMEYWNENSTKLIPILNMIRSVFADIAPLLVQAFVQIAWAITTVVEKLLEFVGQYPNLSKWIIELLLAGFALRRLITLLGVAKNFAIGLKTAFSMFGSGLFSGIGKSVTSIVGVFGKIKNIATVIAPIFKSIGGKMIMFVLDGIMMFGQKILGNIVMWAARALMAFLPLLANPITWIVMAVIGLIYLIYTYWDEISATIGSVFQSVLEGIGTFFSWVANGFSWLFASIAEFFNNLIAGTFEAGSALISGFGNAIDTVKTFFGSLLSMALDILSRIAQAIQNWVMDKIQWAIDGLNNLRNTANGILDGIGSGISNAYNNLTQVQNNNFSLQTKAQLEAAQAGTSSYFDWYR